MTCLFENRKFWKVLEPIRALEVNKSGHSYIGVTFKELHSGSYSIARIVERTNFYY